jgi:L-seryl-tRNA(Ser) seleniumtransferase
MPSTLLNPAINGTGVILHTGLGRAVLSQAARDAVLSMTERYCTLEIDVPTGKRGSRHEIVSDLLCELTGAESALVVNNNAAAVMLILNTLARDKEVVISRGQLVEIGGSFRMPDVMIESGATLVSVGTTNHTVLSDFEEVLSDRTAILMDVHRSNFDIVGEEISVKLEDLVRLGTKQGIPVVYDLGSGAMMDLSIYGLGSEITVPQSISSGVQVTCFSGDKLLGGPQSGIIVGKKEFLDQMKKNPLMRAIRVDKMIFAALYATLDLFRNPGNLVDSHPVTRMISESLNSLSQRANVLADKLQDVFKHRIDIEVIEATSEIGGGALPVRPLPTFVVAVTPKKWSSHTIAKAFRLSQPAIFGRLVKDQFWLDVRTILSEDIPLIEQSARSILRHLDSEIN